MILKALYALLLLCNNAVAFIFLSLVFLNSPAGPEGEHPLTDQQLIIRLIAYGIVVGLVFSVVTLGTSLLFKKVFTFGVTDLKRIFIWQFLFLLAVYGAIFLFIYLRLFIFQTQF